MTQASCRLPTERGGRFGAGHRRTTPNSGVGLLPTDTLLSPVNPDEVARLIEQGIEDAEASVRRARGEHDDDHLTAEVVSPAFEGVPLVQQHEMVYDALEEHMTTDIHALELKTRTP
jgi:stress-induced morphogen